LPVAKTHTVYRTLGDLHDMLRHLHNPRIVTATLQFRLARW
jgi:hypothetical protein